jgi:molecular chaperone GrpE
MSDAAIPLMRLLRYARNDKDMADEKQNVEEKNDAALTELEACKKQAEEYLNGWKRAKADYLNLKKENEAASAELAQFVAAGMLMKFLPVYDGLKRACQKTPSTSSGNNSLSPGSFDAAQDKLRAVEGWMEGIVNIKKQFEDLFKSFGIEEIKTTGEKFNPEFHEAVSREKKEGVESDIILEEVSGGYTMNGKTIIAAKVIVSQ